NRTGSKPAGCVASACPPTRWWPMVAAPALTFTGIAGTCEGAPDAGPGIPQDRLTSAQATPNWPKAQRRHRACPNVARPAPVADPATAAGKSPAGFPGPGSSVPLPEPAVLDPVAAGGHVAPGTDPAVGAVVESPSAFRVAAGLESRPGAIALRVADH